MATCIKHGYGLHASKSEASDCNRLFSMEQSGEIRSFKVFPNYDLKINGKFFKSWTPDFEFVDASGRVCIMESKRGWKHSDDRARMKMCAFMLTYPEIPLYINFQRARLSRDGRLLCEGYRTPQKRKITAIKTYNAKTHKWDVVSPSSVGSAVIEMGKPKRLRRRIHITSKGKEMIRKRYSTSSRRGKMPLLKIRSPIQM